MNRSDKENSKVLDALQIKDTNAKIDVMLANINSVSDEELESLLVSAQKVYQSKSGTYIPSNVIPLFSYFS
jgi:hypothetical protein